MADISFRVIIEKGSLQKYFLEAISIRYWSKIAASYLLLEKY